MGERAYLYHWSDGIRITGPDWVVAELREQMGRVESLYSGGR